MLIDVAPLHLEGERDNRWVAAPRAHTVNTRPDLGKSLNPGCTRPLANGIAVTDILKPFAGDIGHN